MTNDDEVILACPFCESMNLSGPYPDFRGRRPNEPIWRIECNGCGAAISASQPQYAILACCPLLPENS